MRIHYVNCGGIKIVELIEKIEFYGDTLICHRSESSTYYNADRPTFQVDCDKVEKVTDYF